MYSQELIDDSTEYGGGNFGFWDQRTALEWTFQNIEWFGGDKHNITVAGLSAGSYSTFHQMAHELLKPGSDIQTIRRVALWSNGCGTKPKSLPEAQSQFDELLKVLDIPLDATSGEKLARLRKVSTQGIIDAIDLMEQRAFKPASDNDFIQDGLWQELFAGTLGSKMRALGMKIMIGEVSKEENGYKFYDTPTSYPSLIRRLCREYSKELVLAICKEYRPKNSIMEPSATQWREIYGDLFSGVQVRASSRGLIDCLVKGGLPPSSIIRYRIDWRISALARTTPPDLGPTHAR